MSNGPSSITSQSTNGGHVFANGGVNQCNETGTTSMSKLERPLPFSSTTDSSKTIDALETSDKQQNELLDLSSSRTSPPPVPASESHLSSLDPLLLPSQDFPLPSAAGTIRHERNHHNSSELITDDSTERKLASVQQKRSNDFHEVGKTQHVESVQTVASTAVTSSISKPSSNYNNQSQLAGPQKGIILDLAI